MILVAGLGNPDKEYEKTRHNYGFRVIDRLAEKNNFPPFKMSKENNALISMDGNIILAKPQTYMNNSGKAIKKIASYYKIEPKDIIVVHDDADIDLGEIKIAEGRTSAGHKGAQSTINELGTKNFLRIRMGINSEDPSYKKPIERGGGLEAVVLENFSKDEEVLVSKATEEAITKIEELRKR